MLLPVMERLGKRALNAREIHSRFVDTALARHHLYDARGSGDLPTVVVLHGISSAATPFGAVISRLRAHTRRVLAPDAPGHGFSGAPREPLTPETLFASMSELFDRELDEPAILFGNSLGGATAIRYAIARPERVRGVFLASPAGAAMTAMELNRFLGRFRLRSRADARAFLDRIYHRKPWFAPLLAADVKRLFARDAIRSFTDAVRAEHLFRPEELAGLTVPVHLVWGKSERLLPPESLAYFKAHLPSHATIEEPEGFGHCPHFDNPRALVEKIVAFARRL